MKARKLATLGAAVGLLGLYCAPAAIAAYNTPSSYGPLTGDCTTPSSTNPATTCGKFNGGTSFGSMAGQAASAVAITGGSITGVSIGSAVRVVTASGGITMLASDGFVCVNKTTGAATAITGESSPVTGAIHYIKDCKGDAATNNITFTPASGTVDGAANYVLTANYQTVGIVFNGTQWNLF